MGELPVAGGRLTVQVGSDGRVKSVTNGLASVPATILPPAVPTSDDVKLRLPPGVTAKAILRKRVLVPHEGGLQPVDLGFWVGPDGAVQTALLAGESVVEDLGPVRDAPALAAAKLARDQGGLPSFISFRATGGMKLHRLPGDLNPADSIYRFLEENPMLLGLQQPRCALAVKRIVTTPDLPGVVQVHFEQVHGGVPVFASGYAFQVEDDGKSLMTIGGHLAGALEAVGARPKMSAAMLRDSIEARVIDQLDLDDDVAVLAAAAPVRSKLVVFDKRILGDAAARPFLAYEVIAGGRQLVVDAGTGAVREGFGFVFTETEPKRLVNEGHGKSEWDRLGFTEVAVDGAPKDGQQLAADAQEAMTSLEGVDAFYRDHGWFGLNNEGQNLVANVDLNLASVSCPNAFFLPFVFEETFFCQMETVPDVVGHEISHGVIHKTASFIYSGMQGSLHESYADVLGTAAFPDANPADWLLGERFDPTTGALTTVTRDFLATNINNLREVLPADPNCNNPFDRFVCDDYGFVHANSGLNTLAHVFVADGVTGLTRGMGRARMGTTAFDTLTQRLVPSTSYADIARESNDMCKSIAARRDSVEDEMVRARLPVVEDCDSVLAAFSAVGVESDLSTGWVELRGAQFNGTKTVFAGESTANGCNVENVLLSIPAAFGGESADLSPLTDITNFIVLPSGGMALGGVLQPDPPLPIGTTSKQVQVTWATLWTGNVPGFQVDVVTENPPAGAVDCTHAPGRLRAELVTDTLVRKSFLPGLAPASGVDRLTLRVSEGCIVDRVLLELLDDEGHVIDGPAASVRDAIAVQVLGLRLEAVRGVTQRAVRDPAGNLVRDLRWRVDTLHHDATFRVRLIASQAPGSRCELL